ncbi:TPA: NAD(P)/FAD-dependent oxidoreductase [Candidatus Poribacteria bacterium]|nr:NAD(P)/FAD-dependent oxidoreductase [Candidatus Poribacteria bacterium]
MTSDNMMDLTSLPRSMVILGAGVVGCEFATIFANFGQTKIYLIDQADRILPFEDEDVSRICSTNLEAKGVTIHHRARLLSMEVVDDQVEYTIEHYTGGEEAIRVECAMISVGRVPNILGLDLDKAGVAVNDQGRIINNNTQTSVPHIYVIGDVSTDKALVSIGEIQGRYVIEHIYESTDNVLSYDNLSTIMFLDPEVAAIGLNEQQAQDSRTPCQVSVYGYSLVNRAIAMRATGGFVKLLLVTDDKDMRILGMRVLGVHASTTIEAVSLMMKHDCSVRDLAELLDPHPAVTEGYRNVHVCYLALRFINLKYFDLICGYRGLHIPIRLSEIQESQT